MPGCFHAVSILYFNFYFVVVHLRRRRVQDGTDTSCEDEINRNEWVEREQEETNTQRVGTRQENVRWEEDRGTVTGVEGGEEDEDGQTL